MWEWKEWIYFLFDCFDQRELVIQSSDIQYLMYKGAQTMTKFD